MILVPTIVGKGWGPAVQSNKQWFTVLPNHAWLPQASFNEAEPFVTAVTFAPIKRIRNTSGDWRSTSLRPCRFGMAYRAWQARAVATPLSRPVSAITGFPSVSLIRLPNTWLFYAHRRAINLHASGTVWFYCLEEIATWVSAVGRPA